MLQKKCSNVVIESTHRIRLRAAAYNRPSQVLTTQSASSVWNALYRDLDITSWTMTAFRSESVKSCSSFVPKWKERAHALGHDDSNQPAQTSSVTQLELSLIHI